MSWTVVSDAKVVWACRDSINSKGEETQSFFKVGIKIEMANGDWWFNHLKTKSWTHHYKGMTVVGKGFNAHSESVEKKDSYSPLSLKREFSSRPKLLSALEDGIVLAWENEAAKRAS